MKIGVLREADDRRRALVPEVVKKFLRFDDIEIVVEESLTELFADDEYRAAGATTSTRDEVLSTSDMILRVNALDKSEVNKMKKGAISISFVDPYNNKDLVESFMQANVSAISMEMIPRTTLAQKMDALSSQASLAGYQAVLYGANQLDKIFPMMMTPAGTIKPSKVFVIGAGVAGLQAIATAKRLGARVTAFDTRPVVKEQVESLGGKFLEIDLGETGQTKGGYAKALTDEQLEMQRKAMLKECATSDLVITTAKLFGRKAPIIITKEMVKSMKQGSVIVDLAAGTGGNVEGTVKNEVVELDGVKIVGIDKLEAMVGLDSSLMYANNLYNLFAHFYDKESKLFKLDRTDEIMSSALITHAGEMVNERLKEVYGGKK